MRCVAQERLGPACGRPTPAIEAEPGWYLRSEIIWYLPNCQPESVQDRVTRAHEHIFMLPKSAHYFYDNQTLPGDHGRNMRSV